MGSKTGIEWTDATWNPILGCSRVSEGCRNCYAEGIAGRFGQGRETVYSGLTQIVNGRPVWTGKIVETRQLLQPLSWRKPKRVLVNSMSDLFHENVTHEQRSHIFATMALSPQHTFQVLTKRPAEMLKWMRDVAMVRSPGPRERAFSVVQSMPGYDHEHPKWIRLACDAFTGRWPLPNVWLGVSVENQATADERIPLLLQTPAAVRFISAEPLLGPVSLEELPSASGIGRYLNALSNAGVDPGALIPMKLDWVIAGGESGPHARPMHPEWARSLRDQCQAASVPFFFKQWGEYVPEGPQYPEEYGKEFPEMNEVELSGRDFPLEGVLYRDSYFYDGIEHQPHINSGAWWMDRVGKKAAGAALDGREWKEFPKAGNKGSREQGIADGGQEVRG